MFAAILLAAGLAACGSSGSSSSTTTQTSASATNASAAAPATSSTAAPGTSLAAGQTATVPFQTTTKTGANGPTYKLEVNVESIKKGSLSDFNGIQLDANEKASTPYYAKVKITNIGPSSIDTSSNDPSVSVEGVDNTGNTQTSVTFFGTFPPCPDADTPNPLHTGQSFETCLTYLVPGGITKVAYTGTDAYDTSPVTWAAK